MKSCQISKFVRLPLILVPLLKQGNNVSATAHISKRRQPHWYPHPSDQPLIVVLDITGNELSSRGMIDVRGVFGVKARTLRGADPLASSLNAFVIMPDICKDAFADPAWFPPDTEEKKEAAAKIRAKMENTADTLPVLLRTVVEANHKWPTTQGLGSCWILLRWEGMRQSDRMRVAPRLMVMVGL